VPLLARVHKLARMLGQAQGERSGRVHSRLNVSRLLFHKYSRMFAHLFSLHYARLPQLFRFGWLFFALVRDAYPQLGADLVNSHRLLICCMHLLCLSGSSVLAQPQPLGIDYLCSRFDGEPLQVKTVNEHYFKHQLDAFKADAADTPLLDAAGRVDLGQLDRLLEKLEALYERSLGAREETGGAVVDERMFLDAPAQVSDFVWTGGSVELNL
jgi:hypothetical protein